MKETTNDTLIVNISNTCTTGLSFIGLSKKSEFDPVKCKGAMYTSTTRSVDEPHASRRYSLIKLKRRRSKFNDNQICIILRT